MLKWQEYLCLKQNVYNFKINYINFSKLKPIGFKHTINKLQQNNKIILILKTRLQFVVLDI